MKPINIIGLGYIGLPTALMFASHGVEIIGTDMNAELIAKLNNNILTFEEQGLLNVFQKALTAGIKFQQEYAQTDKYIVTVPTPYLKDSKKLDPSYVEQAVKQVLEVCLPGTILIIESTISPGTIDKIVRPMIHKHNLTIGKDIHLVHAPERIIPGNMVHELEHNARTIGADSSEIGLEVKTWYESFCRGEIVVTDVKTAEMSKVIENTFRDINIAFANELAQMCHKEGMDVYELIQIANRHPRVNILQPGPGVGGHCISVDPWFLVGDYPEIVNIVLAAREVNDSMPTYVFDKMHVIMKEHGIKEYSKVGLYGLTYKENVDDIRESPTLQLLDVFHKYNIEDVKIYDPYIQEQYFTGQMHDYQEFIDAVELIIVLVAHDEIKLQQNALEDKIIYDTRNVIRTSKKLYKM